MMTEVKTRLDEEMSEVGFISSWKYPKSIFQIFFVWDVIIYVIYRWRQRLGVILCQPIIAVAIYTKAYAFSWSFYQAIFNLFEWLEFQNYDSGDQLVSSHIIKRRTILGHYDVTIQIRWRHEPASRLKLSSVDNETLLRARWISVCSLDWSWSNSESTKYYSNVMTNILKWVICSWVTIASLWVIFSINDSNLSRNLRVLLRLHHLKKIAPKQPRVISKISTLENQIRNSCRELNTKWR